MKIERKHIGSRVRLKLEVDGILVAIADRCMGDDRRAEVQFDHDALPTRMMGGGTICTVRAADLTVLAPEIAIGDIVSGGEDSAIGPSVVVRIHDGVAAIGSLGREERPNADERPSITWHFAEIEDLTMLQKATYQDVE